MNKWFICLLILTGMFTHSVKAQSKTNLRKELLFGFGATNFLGDLGGSPKIGSEPFSMRDLNWTSTRPMFQLGYRYRIDKKSGYIYKIAFGYLYGNDSFTENDVRFNRNINFRAPIFELSAKYEYFVFVREREGHRYSRKELKGWKEIYDKIYIFAGLGVSVFIPQGQYLDGNWYNLRSYSTEGQGMVGTRKKYSLIQPVIPIGIGFKYAISKEWSIGLEYGLRKTFTDYIDDTSTTYYNNYEIRTQKGDIAAYFADPSRGLIDGQTLPGAQRGDPTDKDSYMFATLSFYYKLKKSKSYPITKPKF